MQAVIIGALVVITNGLATLVLTTTKDDEVKTIVFTINTLGIILGLIAVAIK